MADDATLHDITASPNPPVAAERRNQWRTLHSVVAVHPGCRCGDWPHSFKQRLQ